MYIVPIDSQTTSFNGNLITKGKWPKELQKTVSEAKAFQNLAEGDYDIFVSLSKKTATSNDINHTRGDKLYKLKISAKKSKPTFLDKIKNIIGLNPRCTVNKNYHSVYGLERIINDCVKENFLRSRLNLK